MKLKRNMPNFLFYKNLDRINKKYIRKEGGIINKKSFRVDYENKKNDVAAAGLEPTTHGL